MTERPHLRVVDPSFVARVSEQVPPAGPVIIHKPRLVGRPEGSMGSLFVPDDDARDVIVREKLSHLAMLRRRDWTDDVTY